MYMDQANWCGSFFFLTPLTEGSVRRQDGSSRSTTRAQPEGARLLTHPAAGPFGKIADGSNLWGWDGG